MRKKKDERGLVRHPILLDIVLFIVVFITLYAAVQSTVSNTRSSDALERVEVSSSCSKMILFEVVKAANERSQFSLAQSQANLQLQQAQASMVGTFLDADANAELRRKVFADYFNSLNQYIKVTTSQQNQQISNPWPTETQYLNCLEGRDRSK